MQNISYVLLVIESTDAQVSLWNQIHAHWGKMGEGLTKFTSINSEELFFI
jgi:hypothetical protein